MADPLYKFTNPANGIFSLSIDIFRMIRGWPDPGRCPLKFISDEIQ